MRRFLNEFSRNAAKEAAQAGNRLVESTGSLDLDVMAFQEVEFRKLDPQREYINQNRSRIPQLAAEMEEIMRIGVTANYSRPPPSIPRRKGSPYKDKDSLEIVEKLWADVRKGRIFICGTKCIGGDNAQIEATPSTLVPKRNPDRSWSSEKRVIADLRRINLYFDNQELYLVELPTVKDFARGIISLKRKSPLSDVALAKRDIKSAFRLIRIHPQLSRVMVTEFGGRHFGLEEDVLLFYGVIPFGWGGSPSHFCRFSDAISILHQLHGPCHQLWNMGMAFRSKMYIDDGIFIELDMGSRLGQSTGKWEEIAKGCLSDDAINEEKNLLEGLCGVSLRFYWGLKSTLRI